MAASSSTPSTYQSESEEEDCMIYVPPVGPLKSFLDPSDSDEEDSDYSSAEDDEDEIQKMFHPVQAGKTEVKPAPPAVGDEEVEHAIPLEWAAIQRAEGTSLRIWLLKQVEFNIHLVSLLKGKELGRPYLCHLFREVFSEGGDPKTPARLASYPDAFSASEWCQLLRPVTVKAFLGKYFWEKGVGAKKTLPKPPTGWNPETPIPIQLSQIKQLADFYFTPAAFVSSPKTDPEAYINEFYKLYAEWGDYDPAIFTNFSSYQIDGKGDEYVIFSTLDPDQILTTNIKSAFAFGTVEEAVGLLGQLEDGYDASPTYALMVTIWAGRTDILEGCLKALTLEQVKEELPRLVGATSRFMPYLEVIYRVFPTQMAELCGRDEVLLPLLNLGDVNSISFLLNRCGEGVVDAEARAKLRATAEGLGFDDLQGWF